MDTVAFLRLCHKSTVWVDIPRRVSQHGGSTNQFPKVLALEHVKYIYIYYIYMNIQNIHYATHISSSKLELVACLGHEHPFYWHKETWSSHRST